MAKFRRKFKKVGKTTRPFMFEEKGKNLGSQETEHKTKLHQLFL